MARFSLSGKAVFIGLLVPRLFFQGALTPIPPFAPRKAVLAGALLACALMLGSSLPVSFARAASQVGVTAAVNQTTFGTPPGAERKVMVLGEDVIYRHRIETSADGLAQILLNDGSAFTIGPGSNLVIDEFVYDPGSGTGTLIATLSKGAARFVGGRVSKQREGVSVKTPVGTIGIRGGIANLNLSGGNPTFSLLFGEELIFDNGSGTTRRIFEAGYTLEISTGGDGRSSIRRTTRSDLGQMQGNLSGSRGQSGGSSTPPNDGNVRNSGFARTNSELPFASVMPPPKPKVIQTTRLGDAEQEHAPPSTSNEDNVLANTSRQSADPAPADPAPGNPQPGDDEGAGQTPDPSASPDPSPESEPDPTPDPSPDPDPAPDPDPDPDPDEPEVTTLNVRILRASGDLAVPDAGSIVVANPGAQGLLGYGELDDYSAIFTVSDVASSNVLSVSGAAEGQSIVLYPHENGDLTYFQLAYASGNALKVYGNHFVPALDPETDWDEEESGPIEGFFRGVTYLDTDAGFFTFALWPGVEVSQEYDVGDIIFGFSGEATDLDTLLDDSEPAYLRHYDLSTDPVLAFSLGTEYENGEYLPFESDVLMINPLVAAEFGADFVSSIYSTGLYALEPGDGSIDGTDLLASSFLISGAGAEQKSFVSLLVADLYLNDDEEYTADWGRRGSQRVASDQSAARFAGGGSLLANSNGETIFGPDAEYLIISSDVDEEYTYGDSYMATPDFVSDSSERFFGSIQVASLESKTDADTLDRSSVSYQGYAAAAVETSMSYDFDDGGARLFQTELPSELSLVLDAEAKEVQVSIEVYDQEIFNDASEFGDSYLNGLHFQFGTSSDGSGGHRGVFIDMDTYAARDAKDVGDQYVLTESGDVLSHESASNANNYIIPDTLTGTGDDSLFTGVTQCTCEFMEWGYWGASIEVDGNDSDDLPDGEQYIRVHMGTWVTGDVLDASELPTSGVATYAGHAVGNVISGTGNSADQYLAAGNFNMSLDFARRIGDAEITEFDGRDFSGDLSQLDGNVFTGSLQNSSSANVGAINTSVVRGPDSDIQGVIGAFNVEDGVWRATGIVAGELAGVSGGSD